MSREESITRRDFIASTSAAAAYSLLAGPVWGEQKGKWRPSRM